MRTSVTACVTGLLLAGTTGAFAQAPAAAQGQIVERIACKGDPTQTYTAYLPPTYSVGRKWPILFIFDPRGRGTFAAQIFREAAEQYGWILASSDNTRSDGPWEPNQRAIAAMWPDVLERFPVDERRIYAAGFSGGASLAWVLGRESGALAGVIAAGAPEPERTSAKPITFAWFGAAGRRDFNFIHAAAIAKRVADAGRPQRVEYFEGAHEWLPSAMATRAAGWLEALAMKEQRAPQSQERAARILAADVAAARELEAAGRLTDARRLYDSVSDALAGTIDVTAVVERRHVLQADARLAAARREEERAERQERARLTDLAKGLGLLFANELPSFSELTSALDLRRLQRDARESGPKGEAAQRTLETIFVQASFYIWRDFEQRRDFARAALSLEIAAAIHPDRPRVWYDLAAARAMRGSRRSALEALGRAVDAGFRDRARLDADGRFAPLREDPQFKSILQRLPPREK